MPESLFEEFEQKSAAGPTDRALFRAVAQDQPEELDRLLLERPALDARDPQNGRGLVGTAVYLHRHRALSALLAAGADPEEADKEGRPALHLATRAHCADCVGALLAAGADREAEDAKGLFPLFLAAELDAERHSLSFIKAMLEAGANPNHLSEPGYFALSSAACAGRVSDIEALIERGALVDLADRDGFTALHFAIHFKHAKAVACLLSNGADVAHRAPMNGRPVDAAERAAASGDPEIGAMVYAFKETVDLRLSFPSLERFAKKPRAKAAL